ncbi:MAG: hypothetical protein MJ181_08000 [Treponema sp.]|nr:hypothetical protein [Treponema sp.]
MFKLTRGKKFFWTAFSVAGIFCAFFTSCKIGLGEKIDAQKPEVYIESPESIDYIRDSFEISGTCSDDTFVESVSVILKEMNSKTKYGPYDGELSEDKKSWIVNVDNSIDEETGERKLPDGEYQATVTVLDSGKRKNETERSFFIDNTAPVLVLETPSTSNTAYSHEYYGQQLNVNGQVTDFSGTSLLEFYFYSDKDLTKPVVTDEDGNEIPLTLEDVPAKISEVITDFAEKEGFYKKIYGDGSGEKVFYGKVLAYDFARKNPAEEGDKGNCSEGFYFIDETFTKGFSFSLNPKNNPVYSLSQYSSISMAGNEKIDWSENKIQNGTSIGINVQAGLDKYLIVEDSLSVVAYQCDDKGKVKDNEKGIVLFPAAIDKENNKLITDEEELKERGLKIKANGSYNRNISVDIKKTAEGLQVGNYYIIKVQGWDSKGNDFRTENEEVYGFQLISNGAAPVVKILEPVASNDLIFLQKEGLKVSGIAEHDEGIPEVHLFIGDREYTDPSGDVINNFDYKIPLEEFAEGSNTIIVRAIYGEVQAEEKRTVMKDTDKPSISSLQISPVVNETDDNGEVVKKFVNGKITITGLIQDLYGLEESSYRIFGRYDGKEVLIKEGKDLSTPSFILKNIETDIEELKTVESEVKLVVEIKAKDPAGNEAVSILDEFIIDQKTDLPEINISENLIKPVKAGEWLSTNQKLSTLNLMEFLTGNIKDDDGVASAKISLYDADPETLTYKADEVSKSFTTRILDPKNNVRLDFSEQMPGDSGFYYLVVEAEDVNGKKTVYESFIKISGNMAEISLTEGNKEFVTQKPEGKCKLTIKGNVSGESSDDNPLTIYLLDSNDKSISEIDKWVKIWEAGSSKSDNPYYSGTTATWEAELDFSKIFTGLTTEGTNSLILRVLDENKKYTDTGFTYFLDNTTPVIKEISKPFEDGFYISSDNYQFKGVIEETGSGIKDVFYQFVKHGADGETVQADEDKWLRLDGSGINFFQGFVSGHDSQEDRIGEGEYSLFFKLVDETELVSDIAERKFHVDLQKPEISFASEIKALKNVNETFALSGTVFDSCCLPEKVYLTENNGDPIEIAISLSDSTTGTWSTGEKKFPSGDFAAVDGIYTYTIRVEDTSGKISSDTFEVVYDIHSPEVNTITITEPTAKDKVVENKIVKAETFRFNGETTDPENGAGLSKIFWAINSSETVPEKGEAWSSVINGAPAVWSFAKLFEEGTEGNYWVHVYAEDNAGNESEVVTEAFCVDFNDPELSAGFPEASVITSAFTLGGTARDTNALKGKVSVLQAINGGSEVLVEEVTVGNDGTWTCSRQLPYVSDGDAEDGTYSFRVETYDVCGKKAEVSSIDYVYDVNAPVACSWTENGETKTFTVNGTAYSELDSTFWFQTNTLRLEGYFEDTGTGVESVTCEITKEGEKITGTSSEKTVTPVAVNSGKTIYRYSVDFDGLPSGKLLISVWAEDKVPAEDSNKADHKSSLSEYLVNVDFDAPQIICDKVDLLSNGTADIVIEGRLTEIGSGISKIEGWIGSPSTNLVSSDKPDTNKTRGNINWEKNIQTGIITFKFVIDADNTNNWFSSLGTESDVYVQVYDAAGNSSYKVIASITIDTEPPKVDIEQPAVGSITDNEFVFKGSVRDNGKIENIVLQYESTSTDSPWRNLVYDESDISGSYWNITVNTKDYSDIKNNSTEEGIVGMNLRVLATDTAGNSSLSSVVPPTRMITLDPKTDRPVITLGNMTNTDGQGCTLKYRNVTGTIQDDDGLVTNLWFTLDKDLAAATESLPEAYALFALGDEADSDEDFDSDCLTQWVPISVSNVTWSLAEEIERLDDDTEYEIFFYCVDSKGGKFTTAVTDNEETVNGRIVLKYKNSSKEYADGTGAKFTFSTDVPEFGMIYVASSDSTSDLNLTWKNVSECYFGGNQKYLFAKIEVLTRSPIDGDTPLTLKINSKDAEISESQGSLKLVDTHYVDADGNTVESKKGNRYQYTYVAGPFDMTEKKSGEFLYPENGSAEFTWIAKSGSGKTLQKSVYVNTDHSGPKARITSPKEDNPVYGEITVSGIVTDDKAGTAMIQYAVPEVHNGVQQTVEEITKWKTVTGTASFDILFTNSDTEKEMAWYVNEYYPSDDKGVSKVPVYFRLTDKLGNVTLQNNLFISYDENSEIPSCAFNYPTSEVTAVSGDIDVSVLAKGGSGVDEVHLQILPLEEEVYEVAADGSKTKLDSETINQSFEKSENVESDELLAYFQTVYSWGMYIYGEKLFALDADGNVIPETSLGVTPIKHWYILADSNTYWTKTVSTSRMTRTTGNKLTRVSKLGIRAEAYYAGKTKGWAYTEVVVNFDQPSIKNLKFVQRNKANANEAGCETLFTYEYKENMYLPLPKDGFNWYLDGFCQESSDEEKQKLATFEAVTLNSAAGHFDSVYKEMAAGTGEYEFSLPLILEGVDGKVRASLVVTNVSGKGGDSPTFVEFNIDKTSPEIGSLAEASGNGTITNKNLYFQMNGSFIELGSGLQSLVYYFKRTTKSGSNSINPRIYDTEISSLENPSANRIDLAQAENDSGNIFINDDEIPVMKISGAARPSQNQISHNLVKNNIHIRANTSLIRIGGNYYTVTEVNEPEGIVTFDGNVDRSVTEAQLVYAKAVSSKSIENASGTWSDSIRSDNISDGPIELHVVAIDKVGNTSHKSVASAVKNNGPRLAKILLGTDLDGSGTFEFAANATINDNTKDMKEFGEFVYYSCLDANDNASQTITIPREESEFVFTIKDKLALIPEFVGGNGDIKYTVQIENAENEKNITVLRRTAQDSLFAMNPDVPEISGMNTDKGYILIENNKKDSNGVNTLNTMSRKSTKDSPCWFGWTFWDSTEETVTGSDSQYAFLKFKALVNTVDKTCPENKIKPFYWNSINDNSIYGSEEVLRTTDLKGHIELEGNITDEIKTLEINGVALGSDPKVSGKVIIKGSSWDDVKLSSLYLRFGDVNFGTGSITVNGKKYYRVAEYKKTNGSAEWVVSSARMNTEKWQFTISKNEFTQKNHYVEWELSLDTSLVAGESQLDVAAEIFSVDTGIGNAEHDGNYSEATSYQMDVVPYISCIETGLGEKDKSNPSVYNRTALGHYPVRGAKGPGGKSWDTSDSEYGERVTVKGFNFGNEVTVHATGFGTDGFEVIPCSSDNVSFNVGNMKSGLLTIETGTGIKTLNNLNDNSKEVNYLSNGQNNIHLSDDVFLDVWEFKNIAIQESSDLKNPTVRFHPTNDMIGASYSNSEYFNMPGRRSATDIYSQYPYMKGQGGYEDSTFAYDKFGNTYGAAQSPYNNGDSVGGYFRFAFGVATVYTSLSPYDAFRGRAGSSDLESNTINIRKYPKADSSEWISNPNRIVSPQIVAEALDSTGRAVMVHIAYADTLTNQIRYRRSVLSPYVNVSSTSPSFASFNPNAQDNYANSTGYHYKIINIPEGYSYAAFAEAITEEGKYHEGDILTNTSDKSIYAFNETGDKLKLVLDENYIRMNNVYFLKGSSLRSVNDFDEEYMIMPFDLSEATSKNASNGNLTVYTGRFPDYYYSVDAYNGQISTAMTSYTNSNGNKPGYPYYKFVNGSITSSSSYTFPFYAPDSLQNLAGQTVHVIASSGKTLNGTEVMELYQKSSSGSDDGKIKANSYKYNAGKSVALGVGQNHYPVVAWHDNDQNKLYISYNTSTNASGKKVDSLTESQMGELELAEYNTHTKKGHVYGKEGQDKKHAFYTVFPYMTTYSGSINLNYYVLTDTSLDINDNWVESTHYNSGGTKSESDDFYNPEGLKTITSYKSGAYKIVSKNAWTTPDNMKYKVMSLKTYNVSDDSLKNEYLIYNSTNVLGTGQLLERKTVQNKTILVPINKTQGQTNDSSTYTVVELFKPENPDDYLVNDGTYVYPSFPIYEFFIDSDEYMGTAVENVNNSFERTRKWENRTIEVLGAGEYGGQDVQMVVCDNGDNTDTIHLAFYDELTGSLKYTSMKFSDSGFFGQTPVVTVDDYGDVGESLTLEVVRTREGGPQIPYIGYYGSKRAKMAYLVDVESEGSKAGSIDNIYTGKWEVTYVPTEKGIGKDKINVALNKDLNGVLKAGKGAEDSVDFVSSKVYSNSTTNPVMGYINANGNLEIGQMR